MGLKVLEITALILILIYFAQHGLGGWSAWRAWFH